MAIEDMKGTVKSINNIWLMNKSPKIEAPNLSGMKKLFEKPTINLNKLQKNQHQTRTHQ